MPGISRTIWKVMKWTALAIVIVAVVAVLSYRRIIDYYAHLRPDERVIAAGVQRARNAANQHAIDSVLHLLHNGDMVMRTGADATSYMLCQMNLHNKTYSHCGLVVIEDGYPYVYHCIGGEDNPGERMRRDSARVFFNPHSNMGIGVARFDLTPTVIDSVLLLLHDYHKRGVLFDMDFDLQTDDKIYCAELLYKVIQGAVHDAHYFRLTHFFGRTYVGVDDLYESSHAKRVCEIRYK